MTDSLTTHGGRVTARVIASLAIGATLVAASATTASAAVGAHATTAYIGGGTTVNIRTAPSVTSTVAYIVSNGASISIDCQLVGSKLGFSSYTDNRTWNRLSNGRYIHDVVTDSPADQARVYLPDGGYVKYSSNIPRCGTSSVAQAAANNALATVGQNDARATGMNFFTNNDWAPGPVGEWTLDCVKLPMASYIKAGRRPATASTAYGVWQVYGSPRRTDTPPVGAMIFFPNLNHITISVGNGRMVSTMGTAEGQWKPNANLPVFGSLYGTPTGWAMP